MNKSARLGTSVLSGSRVGMVGAGRATPWTCCVNNWALLVPAVPAEVDGGASCLRVGAGARAGRLTVSWVRVNV